jgi:hypothetical protein
MLVVSVQLKSYCRFTDRARVPVASESPTSSLQLAQIPFWGARRHGVAVECSDVSRAELLVIGCIATRRVKLPYGMASTTSPYASDPVGRTTLPSTFLRVTPPATFNTSASRPLLRGATSLVVLSCARFDAAPFVSHKEESAQATGIRGSEASTASKCRRRHRPVDTLDDSLPCLLTK